MNTASLLRASVECLQARPRNPRFLAVVDHVMVIRVHVQQHQAERNVVRLDVLVTGARICESGGGLPVDHVPRRLGQEHATHVAAPYRVVVAVELVY